MLKELLCKCIKKKEVTGYDLIWYLTGNAIYVAVALSVVCSIYLNIRAYLSGDICIYIDSLSYPTLLICFVGTVISFLIVAVWMGTKIDEILEKKIIVCPNSRNGKDTEGKAK